MQHFVDWSESQDIPQKSIQNRISVILGYMKYQRLPFDKDEFYQNIEVKKSIREKLKPITLDHIRGILDHTARFEKRVFYILILSSGLRASEALGLRIKDVDTNYKRYLIHVSKEFAKFHKARDTFCSKEVMPLLDQLMKGKQKEDFIFPHNEKRMDYAVVNEDIIFSRCKKRSGIESEDHELTIHGLRAFFISAFEKNSSSFGHEFAGHSKYMDTYHRFTIEEKIEEYIKTEPYLSIYDKHEPLEELDEIKQKLSVLDKLSKNPKFQKLLEELD
ncbi:MAG: tyrosine-type recombinase/integrase [Crenarchaeota archaeon]|nr:tyrosine-type recombinase/integrase [Thermoproteota archaeon]